MTCLDLAVRPLARSRVLLAPARSRARLGVLVAALALVGCDRKDDKKEAEPSFCQKTCAHIRDCGGPFADDELVCVLSCEGSVQDTECEQANDAWWQCLAGAECADILQMPAGGKCGPGFADLAVTCGACFADVDVIEPGKCVAQIECPELLGVSYSCENGTCECSVEETYKTCPEMNVCSEDEAAIRAAAEACCGIPFEPHPLAP